MSRNNRRDGSRPGVGRYERARRIEIEQLEPRRLMHADACSDMDDLLIDQFLLSRGVLPDASEVSSAPTENDLTLALNGGGSGNGLALNSSPASAASVPQIWVTAPAYGIRGQNAVFTVTLDKAPGTAPVTVNFATKNGGASAGLDYTAVKGTLTFSGSETSKTVDVPILTSATVKGPKPNDFSLLLSSATRGKIVANSSKTVIADERPGFQIDINFIGNVPPIVQGAAKAAVNKWQTAITGDLPAVVIGGKFIDDFLMNVRMGLIGGIKSDGKDGRLANAWPMDPDGKKPCIRSAADSGNHTAYEGTTGIDPADTDFPALTAVLTHEMGHALGIGTFWKYQNFFGPDLFPQNLNLLKDAKTAKPTYVGANGVAQYNSYGYTATGVPVEPGVLGHWDEDYLGNELMTPYADDRNPLSRVTLGALADLGYTVNYGRAEPWSPNGALASRAGGSSSAGAGSSNGILTGTWGIVFTFRPNSLESQSTTTTGGTPAPAANRAATVTITPVNQDPTTTIPATATRQTLVARTVQATPAKTPTASGLTTSRAAGFGSYGR